MALYQPQLHQPQTAQTATSPWSAAAGGAAAGVAADRAVMAIQSARSRATWALGIGVGLLALSVFNQGNLSNAQLQAQNVASQTAALSFTTGAGVTGEQVAAMRSQLILLANATASGFFYANPWTSLFNTAPTAVSSTNQIGVIESSQIVQQSNSNLGLLLLLGVGVAAVALS